MTTAAIKFSVGMPPSTRCSGAGACATSPSQSRQAYMGRRVTMTLKLAGIMSSRSDTSSPILTRRALQQGQLLSARSTTTSSRGKCLGNAPRLTRRLRGMSVLAGSSSGLPSASALPAAIDCSTSQGECGAFVRLQHEGELIGIDLLRSRAEAMALKLLDDGDQALVLGMRGDEQLFERCCVVGKRIRRRRHGLTQSFQISGVACKI